MLFNNNSLRTSFLLFIVLFFDESSTDSESEDHSHHFHRHNRLQLQQNGTGLLFINPKEVDIVFGRTRSIEFSYRGVLDEDLVLTLNQSVSSLQLNPPNITINSNATSQQLNVTGIELTSRTFVDVANCTFLNHTQRECPFDKSDAFIQVTVVRSEIISVLVIITGWIYFTAWSVSFYPQIVLNYQRKSVIGLNFDFLILNVIGFACYTIYNMMLYFDYNVQEIYVATHGHRSLIPVLLNDVVFAAHAFLACVLTGLQCFIYERGTQRISYICRCWASALTAFASVALALTVFGALNWLQYINYLSYVKMAVTLSKYFPQAILNFRRKSTIGWSIGNVLLDFSGGFMDICQMCLQASNTNDWTAFYGNPVKFGLGLISMLFDIVFIIQHYFLYREKEVIDYNQVEQIDSPNTTATIDGSPTSTAIAPQPET